MSEDTGYGLILLGTEYIRGFEWQILKGKDGGEGLVAACDRLSLTLWGPDWENLRVQINQFLDDDEFMRIALEEADLNDGLEG